MSEIRETLSNKVISVTMLFVFLLRWLFSLLVGFGIYNGLSTDDKQAQNIDITAGNDINEIFNDPVSDSLFVGEGIAWDVAIFGIATLAALTVNSIVSGIAVRLLALPQNRLWAFVTLFFVPLFVVGSIAIIAPLLGPINTRFVIILSALLDLVAVMGITWRMCIDTSPFRNMNLIDYSNPSYPDPSHPGLIKQ